VATQTSDTRVFDDLFTTTAHNTRSQRYDNIFKTSALWARLHANDRKVLLDGGARIERAIEYGTNGTVKSHGDYETLDLTPQEHLTVAIDDWKQIAGTVSISRAEERKNSGRAKLIDLVDSKLRNLDMSFTEAMNGQLLNPTGATFGTAGNGGKDINPLPLLISKAATTVHAINESNDAYWANQRKASASANSQTITWQAFVSELNNFYNTCSKGTGGRPDIVLTSQLGYEKYEEALQTYLVYRALYDLRRGWRVILPNLEQCALLKIDYTDLEEVANSEEGWADTLIVNQLPPEQRKDFIFQILEFFR